MAQEICLPFQETWVWSLGWEDPLKKEMATHSSILNPENPINRGLVCHSPWCSKESDTTQWLNNHHHHHQISQPAWLMNSRNLFLIVLEAESARSGCQHGGVLVRIFFLVADCLLLTVFSHGGRSKEVLRSLSYKGTNPFTRAAPSWPQYCPKAPPPNVIILGIRLLTCEFWGSAQTLNL